MAWYDDPIIVTAVAVVIIAACAIVIFAMRRMGKATLQPKKSKKEANIDPASTILVFLSKFLRAFKQTLQSTPKMSCACLI